MLVSFLFQRFCDVSAADVHGNNPGRCLICGDCRLVVCSVRIMAGQPTPCLTLHVSAATENFEISSFFFLRYV